MTRDAASFPDLDPQLPSLLTAEVQAFVSNVVFEGDGKLETLLTAPYTYVNQGLAKHYGYSGVTGETFQKVAYPGRRAGLLMLGGVPAANDTASPPSPPTATSSPSASPPRVRRTGPSPTC